MATNTPQLTPQQIVAELDQYIIGQQAAKHDVAIALRNRWRRAKITGEIKNDVMPHNILMIGPTGSGKTEIARRLAKIANGPFVKVEASKFTEVGYVGRDVESMVRELVEQAINMVKIEHEEDVKERANQQVEEIILDAVVPPHPPAVSDESASPTIETTSQDVTREKFRQKIRNGDLNDKKIEISLQAHSRPSLGISMIGEGPLNEAAFHNFQELLTNFLPKKSKTKKVTIAEAKRLLLPQEINKLVDMEAVKEEAIERTKYNGILFIDEIDKIAAAREKVGRDVSREGVQRDLLPIVEGSNVPTKYGIIPTDHILFIAAGAFHMTKPSDLIPELQGRFPIRVELDTLKKEDFCRILQEPNNALTKQYTALFEAEGITLHFEPATITAIAAKAFELNQQGENIGARRLHTVMSYLLKEFLFEVPDTIVPPQTIVITPTIVQQRLEALVKAKNPNEYIL